jgi:adenylate cyclase
MAIEIERKFLVNKERWEASEKGHKTFYKQAYILTDPGKTVRVRLAGEEGYLTIKGPATGFSKAEYEYAIPKEDVEEMIATLCSAAITKWRYKQMHSGKLWEVDEFLDDNEGLLMAEIELQSEDERVDLPHWIEEEVTGDKRYSNSSLSINPYKNWRQ